MLPFFDTPCIYERYMENRPIWYIIVNDIVRHDRFRETPGNMQEVYANVKNRRAAKQDKQRLCDFIAIEQRK